MSLKASMELLSRIRPLDLFRLRTYGDSLATPAVLVWLGFAWVVILLMAGIEGIVWGLVGATLVPQEAAWLRPVSGLFMFFLMFAIIWIVDASLIMSERPRLRSRRWNPGGDQEGVGAVARWAFGVLIRLSIVAVSLYVTAPFLAKLIRADDIAGYHQRQVEHYFAQRDSILKAQIDARATQIESVYRERAQPLEARAQQLTETLALERERRTRIEAEYAPEIEVLRRDLAAAQERVGDELLGRKGRPEGRGPEARKWEANAKRLAEQLAAKQREIETRIAAVSQRIAELEGRLRTDSEELQRLRLEQQERLDRSAAAVEAEQIEALAPRLTFAARSKALQALRESPDERGVPHFETVEGFAQAALGVLFFALIALKLFEPPAMRAYFSETLQLQYRKYLEGGLAEIPGFELHDDPKRRLNPVEFVRLWQAYELDPAAFYADRQALLAVQRPLVEFQAEQAFEQELLAQRKDNLRHELDYSRQRRERELVAYDRELTLRTAQLQAQLANETKAQRDHRRIELAAELQRAREDWARRRDMEEEEIRQRKEEFEQTQALARQELSLREREIERLRDQGQAEIRLADLASQQTHERKLVELRAKRAHEARQARLKGVREELTRLRALASRKGTERHNLREARRKLQETLEAVSHQVQTAESELFALRSQTGGLTQAIAERRAQSAETTRSEKRRFWSRGEQGSGGMTARELERDLKGLERELKSLDKAEQAGSERLERLGDELRVLEVRQSNHDSELRELESDLSAVQARILYYEDSLSAILCSSGEGGLVDADASESPEPTGTTA